MHTLAEFRTQGLADAPVHFIGDFLNDNDELVLAPEEIIFREKGSTLHRHDNTPFDTWT